MLSKKRHQSVATIFAIGNNLLYHAGECFGAFQWEEHESGKRSLLGVAREKVTEMTAAFKQGRFVLETALSDTVGYIQNFWPEASQSRRAISGWIDQLKSWGLLNYVSQEFVPGERGLNRRYRGIDVERFLILLEAAENLLGETVFETYEDGKNNGVQNARGTLLTAIRNAVFTGWGSRRAGRSDEPEPETWEETDAYRAYARWAGETDDGKVDGSAHFSNQYQGETVRDRYKAAIEDWRVARGELGNCRLVKRLKAVWVGIRDRNPLLY